MTWAPRETVLPTGPIPLALACLLSCSPAPSPRPTPPARSPAVHRPVTPQQPALLPQQRQPGAPLPTGTNPAAPAENRNSDWLPPFEPVPGVASRVSVGDEHACALVDSKAWCWGLNSHGQLGLPARDPTWHAPHVIAEQPAVDVAARGMRTCVVLQSGHVQCWGELRAHVFPFVAPLDGAKSSRNCSACACSDRSAIVPGVTDASEVVLGAAHGCVRRRDGGVACWGDNRFGQLGLGNTKPMVAPRAALAPVLGIRKAFKLVASDDTTCALLDDGALWCWSLGAHGELGKRLPARCPTDSSSAKQPCSPRPVRIELAQVSDVVTGSNHFCALAADNVFCWGKTIAISWAISAVPSVRIPRRASSAPKESTR